MLRTFRARGPAVAARLTEPEALRPALLWALRLAVTAALSWVVSRAAPARLKPMAALSPFSMALFAAGLPAGLNPAALLAGCLAGAVNGPPEAFNLCLPLGCAAILGGSLLWGWAAPRLLPKGEVNENVVAATLAGLGTLAPGLFFAGGEPWPSAQALAAALAAMAAAPFMRSALRVRPQSRYLLPEERAGLALTLCATAAGLYSAWPAAALGFSAFLSALAAPAGAMLGLGAGAATLLQSGDARCAAALGLCGAACQLCRRLPRPARAGAAAMAGLAAGLSVSLSVAGVAALCVGPPLAALLPERARARVARWADRPGDGIDPDRLAAILRGRSARRLRAMSAAFGELAEGYLAPAAMPDEQALMADLRERLCAGCAGYGDCWNGGENRAARLLCDLVGAAVEWSDSGTEAGLFEAGAGADLARRCRRSRQFAERVGEPLEDFARTRRARIKRGGENRLISAQFLQAAQMLEALAEQQSRPVRLRDRQAGRAAAVLDRGGIPLSDALVLSGARTELILTLREGRWTPELARAAAARLNRAFGRVYAPQDAGGRTMRFARMPRLMARVGAGSASRQPGGPSGDSCVTAMLDDERLLALICDGMGSGEAAARESGAAARLLGRFLAAGTDLSLAVETVNALMLNLSSEEMFSTVDLLVLNLATGMADFVKLAACPALIAREGAVHRVEGGRLPLGILERVEPAASQVQMMPGDTVLLASDGVMDAVDPDALGALLLSAGDDMNALAEQVLALAAEGAHAPADDRTAICVRVEERANM